jgi:DNA segregation ATPase FtsK/SpoIIIE, S-DNA-T family
MSRSPPRLRRVRIDLTVLDDAGTERDVAVLSRAPVPFADLQAAAPQVFGRSGTACWVGDHRVGGAALLGTQPLVTGAAVGRAPKSGPAAGLSVDVVGGRDAGRFCPLGYGQIVVGRSPGCDLVLGDPDVSREHLRVTVNERAVTVQDLGSTNGASMDGAALGPDAVEFGADAIVQIGESLLALCGDVGPAASTVPAPDGTVRVNRAPSPVRGVQPAVMEIPAAPGRTPAQRIQWLAALLPAAVGVALALAMHSAQFLLFGLMSPLMVLGTASGDRFHWRRERRRATADYRRRAGAAQRQLALRLRAELDERRAAHPDPAAVLRMVQLPAAQLWCRRRGDGLEIRLGLGTAESRLQVGDGPATRAAAELTLVPVTLDLARYSVGLAAPAAAAAASARWLLGQLAAQHSPADLELAILAVPERAADWTWLRWLPHFRGWAASAPDEIRQLLTELTAEVERRRSTQRQQPGWAGRRIVLLVDVAESAAELSGLSAIVGEAHAVGMSALCLAGTRTALPGGCATVCTASGETGSHWQTSCAIGPVAAAVADRVSPAWAEDLARSLAPYVDADAAGDDALPPACRLVDVLDLMPINADTLRARWLGAAPGAQTRIGVGVDGPVAVDLVNDGPHTLIAGTTGSGKSELLQTLVAGLATSHPPTDVAFVLIDYKGGAAFGACAGLPHVTGLVTDLDAHLTRRALRSLEAELVRREQRFAEAGVSDLAGYRAAGEVEPIARLVIVVDEFGALAEELPAFVTGLVGIAQRGRSLGVHLVLATQRPGGVVSPEIRANCALRIALRMTDPAESVDVLRTDHAAVLDPRRPGRAYLDRGRGVELMQVARVSSTLRDNEPVRVVPLGPWRRLPPERSPGGEGHTDLTLLCAAARQAALDARLPPPRRPWLPPLPAALPGSALPSATAHECPIGLADLPDRQDQASATLNLSAGGTVLFTGGAQSGRTTALLSVVLTAASGLSPLELHVYGIDFAGGSLDWLRALPHTGTVADHDPATAAALVGALERSLDLRQRELAASGFGSAGEARTAGEQRACVLMVIDGWDALSRAFDEHDHGASVEGLMGILRGARRTGVTVLIAGERATLVPRLTSLIGERYVLRLTDPADYAAAGVATKLVPAVLAPGHAVRVCDGVEVALAHAGTRPTATALRAAAEDVRRRYLAAPADPALIRVRPLPQRIELAELPVEPGRLTLGLAGPEGEPANIDLFCGAGRLLIAGPGRSGRSTALLALLAQGHRVPGGVLVAAPVRSPLHAEAVRLGTCCLVPDDPIERLVPCREARLMLVDDSEAFLDTPIGEALTVWARAAAEVVLVVSGRADELLVTFRGLAAEARRSRCALLLQPGPADLELVGRRAGRLRAPTIAGRGVILGDPAWGAPFGPEPVPIQVALP